MFLFTYEGHRANAAFCGISFLAFNCLNWLSMASDESQCWHEGNVRSVWLGVIEARLPFDSSWLFCLAAMSAHTLNY